MGGRLLEQWHFPETLVAMVRWHHDPGAAGTHTTLAACIYLANLIAALTGHSFGHQSFAVRGRGEALSILDLKTDSLEKFMIQTLDELKNAKLLNAA